MACVLSGQALAFVAETPFRFKYKKPSTGVSRIAVDPAPRSEHNRVRHGRQVLSRTIKPASGRCYFLGQSLRASECRWWWAAAVGSYAAYVLSHVLTLRKAQQLWPREAGVSTGCFDGYSAAAPAQKWQQQHQQQQREESRWRQP